jgi:phosphatidate cytidylyltransferase
MLKMPSLRNKLSRTLRVNNFTTRTITGVVFVILVAGSVILDAKVFATLFLFVSILTQLEFYHNLEKRGRKPGTYLGLAVGGFLYISLASNALGLFGPFGNALIFLNFFLAGLIFIFELFSNSADPFGNIGTTLTGVFYISLPLGLLNFLYVPVLYPNNFSYGILLGYFLILWLNDTGAYLVGSAIGKHRLFQRISPGKTWEGSIGGALFAVMMAGVLSNYFSALSPLKWIIMALIISIFGTLGDLVESMLKRSLGIKDSGNILPGHGGMLDRFDAVLLSAPAVFVFITIWQ